MTSLTSRFHGSPNPESRTRRATLRSGLGGPQAERSIASASHGMGILPHHPVKIQGRQLSPAGLWLDGVHAPPRLVASWHPLRFERLAIRHDHQTSDLLSLRSKYDPHVRRLHNNKTVIPWYWSTCVHCGPEGTSSLSLPFSSKTRPMIPKPLKVYLPEYRDNSLAVSGRSLTFISSMYDVST
jgi:hypothetical protein